MRVMLIIINEEGVNVDILETPKEISTRNVQGLFRGTYRRHPLIGFVFSCSLVSPYKPIHASIQDIVNRKIIQMVLNGRTNTVKMAVCKRNV